MFLKKEIYTFFLAVTCAENPYFNFNLTKRHSILSESFQNMPKKLLLEHLALKLILFKIFGIDDFINLPSLLFCNIFA